MYSIEYRSVLQNALSADLKYFGKCRCVWPNNHRRKFHTFYEYLNINSIFRSESLVVLTMLTYPLRPIIVSSVPPHLKYIRIEYQNHKMLLLSESVWYLIRFGLFNIKQLLVMDYISNYGLKTYQRWFFEGEKLNEEFYFISLWLFLFFVFVFLLHHTLNWRSMATFYHILS